MSSKKSKSPTVSANARWETTRSEIFRSSVLTWPSPAPQLLAEDRWTLIKRKPVSGNAGAPIFGWRPPTPFRAYVTQFTPGPAFHYEGTNTSGVKITHFGDKGYLPYANVDQGLYFGMSGAGHYPKTSVNCQNQALTECLNKVKNADVNLSESIATLDQTLGMLLSSVRRLVTTLHASHQFLKGNLRSPALLARTLNLPATHASKKELRKAMGNEATSSWLEYQYGWKPLMSDINAALSLVKEQVATNRMRVHAIRNVSYAEELPRLSPRNPGAIMFTSGKVTSGCKVRIDAVVDNPLLFTLDQLGLNPVLLAWELVPFSFVIDWLLPIGNVLQALTTGWGCTFAGGSSTTYTVAKVNFEWTIYPFSKGSIPSASLESLTTYRTVFTTLPWPRFYMKNPFTSLTRAATALSLLHQLAQGYKPLR